MRLSRRYIFTVVFVVVAQLRHLLWNPNIYHSAHNSPQLIRIVNQLNSVLPLYINVNVYIFVQKT
jgi:hypothetical protein